MPKDVRYRTRHELALEMLERHGAVLPHGWVTGDDEMGRPAWFRQRLAERRGALPAGRAVEHEHPRPGGRAAARTAVTAAIPRRPSAGCAPGARRCPRRRGSKLTVRDGEKGPLEVEIVARRVESKVDRRVVGFEESLVVVRYMDGGVLKHDYHLSNAPRDTPLAEFARVAKAEHRIEECLKRCKSEAGLGEYQVRNWRGLAPPHGAVADRDVVPGGGGPSGEKRRSRR